MSNPTSKTLHLAPEHSIYTRCVAELSCPFTRREEVDEETGAIRILPAAKWSDVHFSIQEIAEAGGGKFATAGRTRAQAYTVSPVREGCFTVGTEGSGRTTTWSIAGFQLNKRQAADWRKAVAQKQEDGS